MAESAPDRPHDPRGGWRAAPAAAGKPGCTIPGWLVHDLPVDLLCQPPLAACCGQPWEGFRPGSSAAAGRGPRGVDGFPLLIMLAIALFVFIFIFAATAVGPEATQVRTRLG